VYIKTSILDPVQSKVNKSMIMMMMMMMMMMMVIVIIINSCTENPPLDRKNQIPCNLPLRINKSVHFVNYVLRLGN
jgi:hypothetical protein